MAASRLSAGAVVVRGDGPGRRYLLLRAYRSWDFPKGLVEPGEEPLAAARRELLEETGLREPRWLAEGRFHETPPYARGKVARYYLAAVDTGEVVLGVSAELGRPEHHEYRWLAFADARARLVPRLQAVIDWAEAALAAS